MKDTLQSIDATQRSPLAVSDLWHQKASAATESRHSTDGWFHASSVSSLCPRKLVLPYIANPRTGKPFPAKGGGGGASEDRLLAGHFGHVRRQIIICASGIVARRRRGRASHKAEQDMFYKWITNPTDSLSAVWSYCKKHFCIERPVVDTELNMRGSFDALLSHPRPAIWEFKTWNSFGWSKLFGPEESHVNQAHAYMLMAGVSDACFWYEDVEKFRVREFLIKEDAGITRRMKRCLKTAKAALKNKELPDKASHLRSAQKIPCCWCAGAKFCFGKEGR